MTRKMIVWITIGQKSAKNGAYLVPQSRLHLTQLCAIICLLKVGQNRLILFSNGMSEVKVLLLPNEVQRTKICEFIRKI